MPSIFKLIGLAWEFYRKHPMLNQVLAWMMIVPLTLTFIISGMTDEETILYGLVTQHVAASRPGVIVLSLLVNFGLSLWILWGSACVLVIGKRLVKSPAGRSRSSFKAVRKQGTKFILPLFLTDILRDCLTLLWLFVLIIPALLYHQFMSGMLPYPVLLLLAVLLSIPAVIYRTYTAFYHVIIVCEGKEYWSALRRSGEMVRDHIWTVLWYFLGISLVLFLPSFIATGLIQESIASWDTRFVHVGDLLSSAIICVPLVLYLLTSIVLYKEVLKLHPSHSHGAPKR